MSYVICEKCGGYYELLEGESSKDFDACQCGGKLSYADSINENYAEEKTNEDTEDKNIMEDIENKQGEEITLYCSNCGKYDSEGIFCSKCGGKLVTLKNGKIINNTKNDYSKIIEELENTHIVNNSKSSNELELLFKRINWLGIMVGAGFFVISVFFTAILLALARFELIVFITSSSLLALASGALAVYIGKSRKYVDGLVTGFSIGLIFIGIMVFFGLFDIFFVNIIESPILTTAGGIIGIFIKNKFMD